MGVPSIKEIDILYGIDPSIMDRIVIDADCGVISPQHKAEEGGTQGEMHERIGSTGKGVGTASRDRVMRDPEKFTFMIEMKNLLQYLPINQNMMR